MPAKKSSLPIRTQISAGGVAFRRTGPGTQILIVRIGDPGRWQLPKGIVDAGESPEITAVRETREEGGIETTLVAPLERIEYWYVGDDPDRTRVRFHKFVHFFLLEYVAGDPSDHDWEVAEARWATFDDALELLAFKSERTVAERARELLIADR
jgi:8-oxo-dGTP diphosphatase